jgi:leader peptidase (prepilin peptidase)/N-methyltransferase
VFGLLCFYAFGMGAIVGSFLNVVIHRYPREESIVFPASHCPHCNTPIRWFDNVPVISWLALRARCRTCRKPISPRYPLVELANALFYLAVFLRTGPTIAFVLISAIVTMTIALIYIDADIQILPDVIDLPGIAIGIACGALALGTVLPDLTIAESWKDSIAGAALGAGIIIVITATYWLLRKIEGMGQGDIKMMAMIGAVLGWRAVPAVLFLASITGALFAVPMALKSDKGFQLALPFGVFLGLATLVVLFFGPTLSAWYLALMLR